MAVTTRSLERQAANAPAGPIGDWMRAQVEKIREEMADDAWREFDERKDEVLFSYVVKVRDLVKWWPFGTTIPITIYWKHAAPLVRWLAGPRPGEPVGEPVP
jgi:hypothetical protein